MKQYLKPILPYAVSVYIGAAFMNMCTNLTGSVLSDIMVYYHMNLDRGGMMSFFQFMGGIAAIIIIAGIALFAGTLHDKKLPYETWCATRQEDSKKLKSSVPPVVHCSWRYSYAAK